MAGDEVDQDAEWLTLLKRSFEGLPQDYDQCHREVTRIRHQFQTALATALEPRLNEHLKNQPQVTLAEKQQIAMAVNRDLRLLNLCIKCPVTRSPAILIADYRDDEERTSRFRFSVVRASGKPQRTCTSHHVPQLVLQESPPREENLTLFKRPHKRGDPGPNR